MEGCYELAFILGAALIDAEEWEAAEARLKEAQGTPRFFCVLFFVVCVFSLVAFWLVYVLWCDILSYRHDVVERAVLLIRSNASPLVLTTTIHTTQPSASAWARRRSWTRRGS